MIIYLTFYHTWIKDSCFLSNNYLICFVHVGPHICVELWGDVALTNKCQMPEITEQFFKVTTAYAFTDIAKILFCPTNDIKKSFGKEACIGEGICRGTMSKNLTRKLPLSYSRWDVFHLLSRVILGILFFPHFF